MRTPSLLAFRSWSATIVAARHRSRCGARLRRRPRPLSAGLLLAALAGGAAPALAAPPDAASRAYAAVDPFIGTAGDGHTFPGAVVPFGMIQLVAGHADPAARQGLRLGRGLPSRGLDHRRLLAHALLRHRALRPRRRAADADRRRGAARARRRRQARQRLHLALQPPGRGRAARLLRRDARGLRDPRRAHRQRARRRAPLHLPRRQPGARAHRSAHQPLRLSRQGAVVAAAAAPRTAP